jgi:hypothetical protein
VRAGDEHGHNERRFLGHPLIAAVPAQHVSLLRARRIDVADVVQGGDFAAATCGPHVGAIAGQQQVLAGEDLGRRHGLAGDLDRDRLGGVIEDHEQAPPDRRNGHRDGAIRRRAGGLDRVELVAPEPLACERDRVGVVDRDLEQLGQGGIELPGLVVDRDLLVVLGGGDLREREIVAHVGLVQTSIFMPRVLL